MGKTEAVGSAERPEALSHSSKTTSVEARIQPVVSRQGERFVRRQTEYGNHLVWVYGDYAAEMQDLGKLLGMEVELIS